MSNDQFLFFRLSVATLRSCKILFWPTPFLFLSSGYLASTHLLNTPEIGLLISCGFAAAVQCYFYWRLTLDANLLNQLQSEADLAQLDLVLQSLFGRSAHQETRSLALRMLGIKKLIRNFLICTFCIWPAYLILLGLLIS